MTTDTPFAITAFDVVLVKKDGDRFVFDWPAIETIAAMPVEGAGIRAIAINHVRALLAARDAGQSLRIDTSRLFDAHTGRPLAE